MKGYKTQIHALQIPVASQQIKDTSSCINHYATVDSREYFLDFGQTTIQQQWIYHRIQVL